MYLSVGRALQAEGSSSAKAPRHEYRQYVRRAVRRSVWLQRRSEEGQAEDEVREGSGEGER